MRYQIKPDAAVHTCWDSEAWDGTLSYPGVCAGCDQAAEHECLFCGYGHVFTTHNPEAHWDTEDDTEPDDTIADHEIHKEGYVDVTDEWTDSPHLYNEGVV